MRGSRIDKVKGLIALASLLVLSGAIIFVFSTMGKARTETDIYAQAPVSTPTMIRGPISPLPTPRAIPTPTHPVAPPTPTWSPPPTLSGPGEIDLPAYFKDDGVISRYGFASGTSSLIVETRKGLDKAQVWGVDSDGKNKRRLPELETITGDLRVGESVWPAPDGRKLAISRGLDGSELLVADSVDRSSTRVATASGAILGFQAWSPDSSRLAYTKFNQKDRTRTLWVVGADGTADHQILAPIGITIGRLVWSRDSSKMAFISGADEHNSLFVLNADGSDLRQIAKFNDPDELPALAEIVWSADSRRVVFSAIFLPPTSARFQPFQNLYIAGIDGDPPKGLTDELSSTPIWLPDGKIRYVTIDQPNKKYVVKEIDPETRSSRALLDFPRDPIPLAPAISAVWAASGDAVVMRVMNDPTLRLVKIK